MAVKTVFSNEEFVQILAGYNLGGLQNAEPISKGTVQTNFVLDTNKGKYIFRYYENRTKESVLFECDLIKYLKIHNYPCPNVFSNKQGELVGESKGKPYAIFEFIEGSHLEKPNEDQKRQLIERVAQLQNLTADYKPLYKEYRWNYDIELCEKLAQKEAQKINSKNAQEKLIWFKKELAKIDLPGSLPKGICHCDFHFSNIFFKDEEFKALIDFDDANYTYLTFDLVSLINPFTKGFEWDTWQKFDREDNVFDFGEARKIIQEYIKYRPLSDDEKRYLFDVFKLSIMLDCLWRFERGDVANFYERRKIEYLNRLGRDEFYSQLFPGEN